MPLTDIPERYRAKADELAQAFANLPKQPIVVAGHVNLDGDALGAMVACAYVAEQVGAQPFLYAVNGIPDFLAFFSQPYPLLTAKDGQRLQPAAAILVDLGDFSRIGGSFQDEVKELPILNIDHHEGTGIGTLATWVEPRACACCELVAYVGITRGLSLSGLFGEALALGLVTDTGGFAHTNTSAEAFALAHLLTQAGVSIPLLREKLANNVRHERMYLWAHLVPKVVFSSEGALALCPVALEDLAVCGAKKEDLEGFVEYILRLQGVAVACVVREDAPTSCKYSLRSRRADVCAVAQSLNGGGHKNAAGGTLSMDLSSACHCLTTHLSSLDLSL
ncbi:MAG: DHH family phosphoesterase [Desulfovibrio sp.]|nr:DHH family phosphoesterase [Desulfovibrio sp.]